MIERTLHKPDDLRPSLHIEHWPTPKTTVGARDEVEAARRVIDRHATDDDEAQRFAAMLGIGGAS